MQQMGNSGLTSLAAKLARYANITRKYWKHVQICCHQQELLKRHVLVQDSNDFGGKMRSVSSYIRTIPFNSWPMIIDDHCCPSKILHGAGILTYIYFHKKDPVGKHIALQSIWVMTFNPQTMIINVMTIVIA